MSMTKKINIVTTQHETDVPFPEAAHWPAYVADQVKQWYPGFAVEVSVGLRAAAFVYGDDNIDVDVLRSRIGNELWDDFCDHGYKAYVVEEID